MPLPVKRKIYHILHHDKLLSVIKRKFLLSDADLRSNQNKSIGTNIGMIRIKDRRINLKLSCYPDLSVGECVPFYFCPRSIMLYIFYCNNHPDVTYSGGQEPIIHLEIDLIKAVNWADKNRIRWVFTDMNAGSRFFEDFNDLNQLSELNWNAINSKNWSDCRDEKQAEFLIENKFPWQLIDRIGVISKEIFEIVDGLLEGAYHKPKIEILPNWYY